MTEKQEIVAYEPPTSSPTLFELPPNQMIEAASQLATVLAGIIDAKKLYVTFRGSRHVKVEGWVTLAALLGYTPREKSVIEHPDGSYEASVEILSLKTGRIVGQASALCGAEENTWGKSPRYARRSMAITRACSKSLRLSLGWIMVLAGYEACPAEEIEALPINNKPPPPQVFESGNPDHILRAKSTLTRMGVEEARFQEILSDLDGKPMNVEVLKSLISKNRE